MTAPSLPNALDSGVTLVSGTDLLHTHLSMGLRALGACPACDQLRADVVSAAGTSLTVDAT